jgi:hypothetical protein
MEFRSRVLWLLFLYLGGCYHANVETGRAPGNQRIEKGWASAYLGGIISPDPIDAKAACVNGVARVETQHSFLNQLVGIATLAIYTPISITVTCATGPTPQRDAGASLEPQPRRTALPQEPQLRKAAASAEAPPKRTASAR